MIVLGLVRSSMAGAAISCLLSVPADSSEPEVLQYSVEPLKQEPLMTRAEVVVDVAHFNNWLVENHASLTKEKLPGPREHAYLLIDSVLKDRQAEGRTDFNEFEVFALKTLFNWGSKLGVYGSGFVAEYLAKGSDETLAPPLLPPKPFELRLDFPYFFLGSQEAGWRLQMPYYFMIWDVKRFTTKNGLETDLVMASTSYAKHNAGEGRSQATLMFMFSPKAERTAFKAFWLDQLTIRRKEKTASSPAPHSRHFETYDQKHKLRKEVTFLDDTTGCFALAYLGIDGTFQVNRVSYADFVRSLNREGVSGRGDR